MGKIIWKDTDMVPPLFFKAMQRDSHPVVGDFSVTEIGNPVQIKWLKMNNDIIESAPDRFWALVGTAIHSILEKAAMGSRGDKLSLMEAADVLDSIFNATGDKKVRDASKWIKSLVKTMVVDEGEYVVEETLMVEFEGLKIYGTYDLRDPKLKRIEDYKYTKAWAYTYRELKEEWDWQLNIYRWMAWKNGIDVDHLRIWGMFRDWDELSVYRNNAYPKYPVMPIDIKIKPFEEVEAYVREKIRQFKAAAHGDVKECNGKERWATADIFKIKSPLLPRAMATFDNREEAVKRLQREQLKNPKIYMEFTPGESKRCSRYCPVRHVCPQWKKIQQQAEENKK